MAMATVTVMLTDASRRSASRSKGRPTGAGRSPIGFAAGRPLGDDAQGGEIASRLNWSRAGVMGANDGIVSTAGMVVGVAGAPCRGWTPGTVPGRAP